MSEAAARLLLLNRRVKRLLLLGLDGALIVLCFLAAMVLRLESFAFDPNVWLAILLLVPLTLWVFARLGLYRSILRFMSGHTLLGIAAGAGVSAAMLLALAQVAALPVPRSVPGIYAVLLFCAVGGLRHAARSALRRAEGFRSVPVAIYGAGVAGRQLHHALIQGCEYAPVAFIDDDPSLQGALIGGRRVYAASQIASLMKRYQITQILLALPSASRDRRREIVANLEPFGVSIKTVPGLGDIVSQRASFSDLRQILPEDLLGRDPVPGLPHLLKRTISGKVVMVSGAGGSIGSELCRQIIQQDPARLILLDVSELALYTLTSELRETLVRMQKPLALEPILASVQNPLRMRAVLNAFSVQTIYHAAAYKHVSLVEENVLEGITNNIFGTHVLAKAAVDQGVENFILISTDKAVRPTNVMGASKRMAELVCQALAQGNGRTTFSMVRFGNVLGSSGSVIPRFKAQIERGGPVTVTHPEVTRYFMTIPEAAQLVLQAGAMAKGGDVFVLDMGAPVKILELAKTMIRLKGFSSYLVEQATRDANAACGDIGILITGLNKGEKLYEELLIGDAPQSTEHPRIMTATELSLPLGEVQALLERLQHACQAPDIVAVRQIFLEAPLQYHPGEGDLHDLVWASQRRAAPPLALLG